MKEVKYILIPGLMTLPLAVVLAAYEKSHRQYPVTHFVYYNVWLFDIY